jgi:hypothetical protein
VVAPYAVPADRRWTPVDVDLAAWAGAPVALVLRVVGWPGAPPLAGRAGFGDPRLID